MRLLGAKRASDPDANVYLGTGRPAGRMLGEGEAIPESSDLRRFHESETLEKRTPKREQYVVDPGRFVDAGCRLDRQRHLRLPLDLSPSEAARGRAAGGQGTKR